ncbi:MAG: ferritin [Austwickia sp.]|jgi:ferritin-like protein|nr:MAG: ferritin [Austwickia sp.]
MSSEQLHEQNLSAQALDRHRAIVSLMEELEAVDWYNQRVEATSDESLRRILEHNRDEEAEHAAMLIEWLRRTYPQFGEELKTYLFTEGDILEAEEKATGKD